MKLLNKIKTFFHQVYDFFVRIKDTVFTVKRTTEKEKQEEVAPQEAQDQSYFGCLTEIEAAKFRTEFYKSQGKFTECAKRNSCEREI